MEQLTVLFLTILFGVFGIPGGIKSFLDLIKDYKLRKQQKNSSQVGQEDASNLLSSFDVAEDIDSEDVISILSNNLYISNKGYYKTGIISNVGCTIFLDIFSPVTNPKNRNILAQILANKIAKIENESNMKFDIISVPKMGNVLLADSVAQILSRPLVIIRLTNAIRFGYPFEGFPQSGQNCILLDDISSDGSLLQSCVAKLRQHGIKVFDCLCLYNRSDGDAISQLSSKNVKLHYFYDLDDDNLKKYINRTDDT